MHSTKCALELYSIIHKMRIWIFILILRKCVSYNPQTWSVRCIIWIVIPFGEEHLAFWVNSVCLIKENDNCTIRYVNCILKEHFSFKILLSKILFVKEFWKSTFGIRDKIPKYPMKIISQIITNKNLYTSFTHPNY